MAQEILEYVKAADQLPSAPGVAMRIVQLNQQDDVDVGELSDLLSQDPALVGKLLKTANSSMFGARREVSNVRQAVMLLGLRTVNLLALSFSAAAVARGDASEGFDYRSYWTQSTATALAARIIARQHRPDLLDEAFLGGMLCDLGRLLIAENFRELYEPVCARIRTEPQSLHLIEQELLGITHMEVGQALFEHWCLPEIVCESIGAHHDPDRISGAGEAYELAKVLSLAAACGELLAGYHAHDRADEIRRLGDAWFGMGWAECEALLDEVGAQVPEAAAALEVSSVDATTIAEIRLQATELMLKASMRLEQQVQTVQEQVDELEARNDALAEQATTDGLTGLRNRRSFDETLESELSRARDFGSGLGLIIIDLDHFKSVNDDYGHQTGDELLRAAAGAIGANAEGAIACRYGGEEFALICPTDDETQLTARAEAIRSAVGQIELSTESGPLRRTASLGGCWAGGEALGRTSRELIESADQELYRAKEDGRDRCYVVSLK